MTVSNRKYQIVAIGVVALASLIYVTRNYWSAGSIIILCILLGTVLLFRYNNCQFVEKWSSIANQLGIEFHSPGSRFQKLIGMECFQEKQNLWLRGLYRNHRLVLTTYSTVEDQEQRGVFYFRLRIGIEQPNITKMFISPRDIPKNHWTTLGTQDILVNPEYLGSKDPFDKKYLIKGDEEDKIKIILDKDIQDKIMSVKNFCMRIDNAGAYIEEPLNTFGFDCVEFNSQIDVALDIIERIEGL
ncbi:hypothetical protein ACFLVR_02815 [Chloroflexota bacterium]